MLLSSWFNQNMNDLIQVTADRDSVKPNWMHAALLVSYAMYIISLIWEKTEYSFNFVIPTLIPSQKCDIITHYSETMIIRTKTEYFPVTKCVWHLFLSQRFDDQISFLYVWSCIKNDFGHAHMYRKLFFGISFK